MSEIAVKDAGNFYIVGFGGNDCRQYRKHVIKATDSPLADREETIIKLCEAFDTLTAENVRLAEEVERERVARDKAEVSLGNAYERLDKYREDLKRSMEENITIIQNGFEIYKNQYKSAVKQAEKNKRMVAVIEASMEQLGGGVHTVEVIDAVHGWLEGALKD